MKQALILLGLLTLIGSVAYAVAPSADNEDVNKDQMGLYRSDGQFAVRVTSSGHIIPGSDKGMDIGSPLRRIRNLYASTIVYSTDSVQNFIAPISTAVNSGITIPVIGGYIIITTTQNSTTMTASPEISTATAQDGDFLFVMNLTTNAVTLRDRLSLVNTGLALGAATRVIGQYDNASFIFNASTGAWIERTFSNVQ